MVRARVRPLLRVGALAITLGLGLGSLAACKDKESEPVAVARVFAETVRRGDVAGMLAVIERPAVERLRDAAETASDQVGGRRSIEPEEMLQIVGVDRTVAVAEAKLIDETDTLAHVELTMTDGRSVRLELVWEQPTAEDAEAGEQARPGGWKVRIPMPSPGAQRFESQPDA